MSAARARSSRAPGAAALPWLGLVAAVAVVAAGSRHWADGDLGTTLPPFVWSWDPRARALELAIAALALALAVVAAPRLLRARLPVAAFAASSYSVALGLGLAVNAVRFGPAGWSRVFDLGPGGSFEAPNEYLPGLPALSYGVRVFLDRFAEVVPSQPVNVAGHPPGPLLLVHALGIDGPGGLAALCILAGSACAPLAYLLGRALDAERTGRVAGLLCACSPCALMFGVTSYDYVFAAAGTLAALTLTTARQRAGGLVASAAAAAAAALMSWALLGAVAWAVVVRLRRDGVRPAVVAALTAAAGIGVLNAILAAGWGYDPVGSLVATEQVYRDSLAQVRPYRFWVVGSPVAWGVALGLPIAGGALRALGTKRPAALALALVVTVAAIGGFTKAETERIWLFLVPLACVAAAPELQDRRLRLVFAALALQLLAFATLVNTVW